jgi:hypothetical protein
LGADALLAACSFHLYHFDDRESLQQRLTRPILLAVNWIGGWGRFILLLLVIAGVAIGLLWERQGGIPLPPQAQSVTSDINSGTARETTFIFPGSPEEVRAFYRQAAGAIAAPKRPPAAQT